MKDLLGVYVHFPFCLSRCSYCDFTTAACSRSSLPHRPYADAVLHELAARASDYPDASLVSIYLGGGTPSLWAATEVARVVAAILATWRTNEEDADADAQVEVTLEANPGDLGERQLRSLAAAGVNRLSLGVQSFDDAMLALLGRRHDARQARQAIALARAAGFANLGLDLLFALPRADDRDGAAARAQEAMRVSIEEAISFEPAHLSLYGLSLEPRTILGQAVRQGRVLLPNDEQYATEFEEAVSRLRAAGLEHYEISNFARPRHRSIHNCLYWNGGTYLGLGCGAHSFRWLGGPGAGRGAAAGGNCTDHAATNEVAGERLANPNELGHYLGRVTAIASATVGTAASTGLPIAERETLAGERLLREQLWLGLRLLEGVDLAGLRRRCGVEQEGSGDSSRRPLDQEIASLVDGGLCEWTAGQRLRLTARGVLLADEVGMRLL